VIRCRYPRDVVPEVDHESDPAAITFYCNDERTPLPDPSPTDVVDNTGADPFADVVAGSVEELRALRLPPLGDGEVPLPDEFEDGILEVYGPPAKRLRTPTPEPESDSLDSQLPQVSQQPVANSEESSAIAKMALLESDTIAHGLCTALTP
jgi:hypothetical protein